MDDLSMSLRVRTSDFGGTYQVYSETIHVPMILAFVLAGVRREVILTLSKPSVKVQLSGLKRMLKNIQVSRSGCFV